MFLQIPKEHSKVWWQGVIAENFNAVSLIIKRTEQYEFCMQIACKNLNFYDNAADSGCIHVIP